MVGPAKFNLQAPNPAHAQFSCLDACQRALGAPACIAHSHNTPPNALAQQTQKIALHFAHHHAQDGALALDGMLQALELFGVRVAARLASEGLAFSRAGLLELYPGALGGADDFVACDLKQAAVCWVCEEGWAIAFS